MSGYILASATRMVPDAIMHDLTGQVQGSRKHFWEDAVWPDEHLVKLCKFVHCKTSDVVHRQALLLFAYKAESDHHVLCVWSTKPVLDQLSFPILQAKSHSVHVLGPSP